MIIVYVTILSRLNRMEQAMLIKIRYESACGEESSARVAFGR